jgi:predicted DNA-binding transcriptional regulator YafY
MRRADRLSQIVQHLRDGRLVTAQKLGEWLEVSERTIYRDIADLQSNGVPIDGEAGVGYLMRQAIAVHRRRRVDAGTDSAPGPA